MKPIRLAGRPRFLTIDEVLFVHRRSLAAYGGMDGVHDGSLLASAVGAAEQGLADGFVHAFPFEMAAAYGFHIAKNHPFVDGNKRTAFGCVLLYLRENGYALELADEDGAALILAVVEGGKDKAWLAERIAGLARPLPSLELRQFFLELNLEEFRSTCKSLPASPQADEMMATIDEATREIPIIGEFRRILRAALAAGDMETADSVFHSTLPLIAIYRIAEDAGYEW